jgi:hypothetical protein
MYTFTIFCNVIYNIYKASVSPGSVQQTMHFFWLYSLERQELLDAPHGLSHEMFSPAQTLG